MQHPWGLPHLPERGDRLDAMESHSRGASNASLAQKAFGDCKVGWTRYLMPNGRRRVVSACIQSAA